MKFTRRTFLAGLGAASVAAALPRGRSWSAPSPEGSLATLIDLTRCDGCPGEEMPRCVAACHVENAARFPEPDPAMLKDYWPKPFHEDWSSKRDIIWRLTPYNWLFVEEVYLEIDGREEVVFIPRRCMHCDDPPCAKLCPFGTAKKTPEGPVYIDPNFCFGGAKCRSVCPWHVPQRQAGVGPYTALDPIPVGGGAMFKCDLCRGRLGKGLPPACQAACPKGAMAFGPREEIRRRAEELAAACGGEVYGRDEHGGTATLYVSRIPFALIDRALTVDEGDAKKVMRFHQPENRGRRHDALAKAALLAPLAGVIGAFAATVSKKEEKK